MTSIKRRKTPSVPVGPVVMGFRHPVVIQSMTNTATEDAAATLAQTLELAAAGAEMVRWTVNNDAAALAVPQIIRQLRGQGCQVPIVGDFHFNGHILLRKYPKMAETLAKFRINPGNIGSGKSFDEHFAEFIRVAVQLRKPVRIGVNAGSLNPGRLSHLMEQNARKKRPRTGRQVLYAAMLESALKSAEAARKLGLRKDQLVLSVKMSDVEDMITVYRQLAARCDYVLHLGLTEAGPDVQGTVASTAALAVLLQEGIGDTIRVSLTPQPDVPRTREVEICRELLQALGLRRFHPRLIACPGCGRTLNADFQSLAQAVRLHIRDRLPEWARRYPGVEQLTVAVMGCVVNGPGESRHADIGLSLPGVSETPQAVVYIGGKQVKILKKDIQTAFLNILEEYLAKRFRPEARNEKGP